MTNRYHKLISPLPLLLILLACEPAAEPSPVISPQDIFFERLTLLCDKAYSGSLVSDDAVDADMAGKSMVMQVANCDLKEIRIPFHVEEKGGKWNRSRTWIITRTDGGLRLKHQHLHEDGKPDSVTNYGGDTRDEGTEERQEFPVDEESIALFKTEGLEQSVTNIWAFEISPPGEPDAKLVYELRRPEGPSVRHFRVEFDLSNPVKSPPPAWGN